MTWLLCDYGGVLCLPQPAEVVAAMAALCGLTPAELEARYWVHRPAYDRGDLDAAAYWAATLERPAADLDRLELGQLVALDVGGWLHPNQASLEAAQRAAERGLRLAVLSNAPTDVARAIDAQPWLAPFSPRVFSCDLRVAKPDAAAYTRILEQLGARPEEVTFVDDRADNVVAARAVGMRAEVFTDPALLDTLS